MNAKPSKEFWIVLILLGFSILFHFISKQKRTGTIRSLEQTNTSLINEVLHKQQTDFLYQNISFVDTVLLINQDFLKIPIKSFLNDNEIGFYYDLNCCSRCISHGLRVIGEYLIRNPDFKLQVISEHQNIRILRHELMERGVLHTACFWNVDLINNIRIDRPFFYQYNNGQLINIYSINHETPEIFIESYFDLVFKQIIP